MGGLTPSINVPVAPHLMRGPAFLPAPRLRKAAGPRVKHGATARLEWKVDDLGRLLSSALYEMADKKGGLCL